MFFKIDESLPLEDQVYTNTEIKQSGHQVHDIAEFLAMKTGAINKSMHVKCYYSTRQNKDYEAVTIRSSVVELIPYTAPDGTKHNLKELDSEPFISSLEDLFHYHSYITQRTRDNKGLIVRVYENLVDI